jgi:hypothetical protein
LCQLMGMPSMMNKVTKHDAQSGADCLSSHASRSSTYCQSACLWSRMACEVRIIRPATRPHAQPLTLAPKCKVMHW